ncbi:MAG: hypothetical protein ACT4O2_04680 [Beijerinckiaceae bacterium]
MTYALVMWVSIVSLGQYKPIVVQGFASAQACNATATAIITELNKKVSATESHTCAPNFSTN